MVRKSDCRERGMIKCKVRGDDCGICGGGWRMEERWDAIFDRCDFDDKMTSSTKMFPNLDRRSTSTCTIPLVTVSYGTLYPPGGI